MKRLKTFKVIQFGGAKRIFVTNYSISLDFISYVFKTNELTGKNVKMLFVIELLLRYWLAVLEQMILVLLFSN